MCGFLLVASRRLPIDRARTRAALDRLHHRGPDARALDFEELPLPGGSDAPPVALALGHTRLSILDVDARSNQPHRRGGSALLYNGEIYNFAEVRAGLAARGEAFTTTGDTEVLHAALIRDGLAALDRAHGMWAFCRLDRARAEITCARDRLGKKPLFHAMTGDLLVIGSEISAVLAALGRTPRLAPGTLESYLAHGWAIPSHDGSTHIDGVREVPPGGSLTIDLAQWTARPGRWWTVERGIAEAAGDGRPLADTLADAVAARLVSDRKVGLLLSGGVDSTLILSVLAARGLTERVRLFIGDAGKSEDADYAARTVAALGLGATRIALDYGAASVAQLLDVCRHHQKPFPFIGSVLSMPQMYEAIAAEGIPVVLDGSGGDEIFAGYPERYLRFAAADAVAAGDRAWLEDVRAARRETPHLARIATEALAALDRGDRRLPPPQPAPALASPYLRDGALLDARNTDPLDGLDAGLTEALVVDTARGRLQEWLWHNDRNAMRSGIENRSPLLDHRLLAHIGSGYRCKIRGAWHKIELRDTFDAFRPAPTQWRSAKQGFRWVYSRFLKPNRAALLELIAASRLLAPIADLPRYLDDVRRDDEVLLDEITLRLLGIAGLEAAMGLAP